MTNLQRFLPREEQLAMGWMDEQGNLNPAFKTPEQGASTSVWAAVGHELEGVGGLYLEDVRAYRETRLQDIGIAPVFPLWQRPTATLARDMIDAVRTVAAGEMYRCPLIAAPRSADPAVDTERRRYEKLTDREREVLR